MQKIVVKQGQSVLDIAIVYTGDVKESFKIAVINNISITDELFPGQILEVPAVVNKRIVELFRDYNQPATAIMESKFIIDDNEEIIPEGIGFWAIEKNFIVS